MWICQDIPPFLLIVSPTPPVQSVDAYVRTHVRSVNHVTTKRKQVDYILWVWDSVAASFARVGAPRKGGKRAEGEGVTAWHLQSINSIIDNIR